MTEPEVVRQSDLLNQLVLDRNTMEELGRWMCCGCILQYIRC